MRLARILVALVVLGSSESLAIGDTWEPRAASIEECRERTRRTKDIAPWYCYYRLGYERRELIPAIVRHLQRIRAREPENIRATFLAAMVDDLRDDARALYDRAQEEFRKRGDVEGEFYVTMAAAGSAGWYGDPERGEAKWARGIGLAPRLGDPDVLAFAFQMGTELALHEADYGRAEVRSARRRTFAGPGPWGWECWDWPWPSWGSRVWSCARGPWLERWPPRK